MKIYDKKLAYPYFVWMVLFTVVPLFIVVYYAMTDAEGNFTLNNLTCHQRLRLGVCAQPAAGAHRYGHLPYHRLSGGRIFCPACG